MLAQHHYEASSPAKCNHNLSLLDAGPLSHQISSETCVSHSTIFTLHSKYFPHPHKPSAGYSSKLSAANTHCVQPLISSWKAVNAAQIAKALVYTKSQPLTSYNVNFNPKKADLKAMPKKKHHFSVSGIGECRWPLLLHIKLQTHFLPFYLRQLMLASYNNSTNFQS